MYKTKHIENFGHILHVVIDNDYEVHNELVPLFTKLGFEDEETLKLDTMFPDLTGHYLYLERTTPSPLKAHLFIEKTVIHLVFDTQGAKDPIKALVLKQFPIVR